MEAPPDTAADATTVLPPTPEPRQVTTSPTLQPSNANQGAPQGGPPPAAPPPAAATGLPDGTHQVRFADGSAYYGEWQGGSMHGRGVFLWPAGRLGEQPGLGMPAAAPGSPHDAATARLPARLLSSALWSRSQQQPQL